MTTSRAWIATDLYARPVLVCKWTIDWTNAYKKERVTLTVAPYEAAPASGLPMSRHGRCQRSEKHLAMVH